MPSKLAVNGSLSGPATVADGLLLSGLGSFPRVHTAPAVPQALPPGSEIVHHLARLGLDRDLSQVVAAVDPPRPRDVTVRHREGLVAQRLVA